MKQTITLGLATAIVSLLAQPVHAEARGGGGGGGGGGHFSGGGGAHFSGGGGAHFSAPAVHSGSGFRGSSVSHFSTAPHYSSYSNVNNYRTYGSGRSNITYAPSIASQNRVYVQPRQSGPTMAFGGSSVRGGRTAPRTLAAPANIARGWDRGHVHDWNHHHYRFYNGNWFAIDGGFYGPYGYGYSDAYPYGYDYGYDQPYYDNGDDYAGPPPAMAMEQSQGFVAAVQNRLTRLGYATGGADGVIGPMTQNALASFQRDHNLSVTGQPDQMTIQALGLD